MSMKNSNDNIGHRTRDLPACSAVPQPTALPPTPVNYLYAVNKFLYKLPEDGDNAETCRSRLIKVHRLWNYSFFCVFKVLKYLASCTLAVSRKAYKSYQVSVIFVRFKSVMGRRVWWQIRKQNLMNNPSALPHLLHEKKYMDGEMFMGGPKR